MGIDYISSKGCQRREGKRTYSHNTGVKYSLAIALQFVSSRDGALCHVFIRIRCIGLDYANTPPIPPIVFSLHPSGPRPIRHSAIHNVVRGDSRVHHIISTMDIRGVDPPNECVPSGAIGGPNYLALGRQGRSSWSGISIASV
jgi:hypothetical protein